MRRSNPLLFCTLLSAGALLFGACASEARQNPPTAQGGGPQTLTADPHSAVGGQPEDQLNSSANTQGNTPQMPVADEPPATTSGQPQR
jgi:hypothetical protein